jgi:hypothetical protein
MATAKQRRKAGKVMHEFKHGELKSGRSGRKVKNPKQAIAIALHEAGATRNEPPAKNRSNLRRTKAKERRGETAEAETEGKAAQDRTLHAQSARRSRTRRGGQTKSELYAEAVRRGIQGRSKMSKGELAQALHG